MGSSAAHTKQGSLFANNNSCSKSRSSYNPLRIRTFIPSILLYTFIFLCVADTLFVSAHPHSHEHRRRHHAHHRLSHRSVDDNTICRPHVSPFDYAVKKRSEFNPSAPICPASSPLQSKYDTTVFKRAVTDEDYSCSESKPCSNGACCSKKTGYCNYGPEACGTTGTSPNDVCWSNCDAHAECGRYSNPPGKACPLNVCCSQYGFCGMTEEFCKKSDKEGEGCQSNCDQPGSGSSGGDVQKKIIGYYEAWAHDRSCAGMDFDKIPVGGLTHLVFSFGFITPGDFNVVPMDGVDESLFTKLTDTKRRNSGLKTMIALGGWTHNDPGPFQKVFSDMVSTKENRSKCIANVISFMRQFAFDGVDFDWEYPGADDRGGTPDDGKNFAQFLKELKEALSKEPLEYQVSFTAPTSYWYLQHFDLAAVQYVDWVNVMSYDLHGTWDSTNPIGSKVLAHTNLTEIKSALDLFWRNSIPANKLNIGVGFYGRSFQLSDPACSTPGCMFSGGADPGACSGNSGTLTYKEISEIITEYGLKPYHDQAAAVKYIVWNQDQWVSYDDEETMQAKIKFANDLGLGGILIWAIDQDTNSLDALKGLLKPKDVDVFKNEKDKKSYWEDMTAQDCYVTDCGGSCKAGFIKVTNQPCGDATFLFRHSSQADSLLCCPISATPDPSTCRWRGEAPDCNGHCQDGEVMVQMNRWGSGKYCENGNKAYCCDVPAGKNTKCYWTGHGDKCNTGDTTMTFAGTFLSTVADIAGLNLLFGPLLEDAINGLDMALKKRFCCPPDEATEWTNCKWHGQPGSCFDNHCDQGHQVQLAQSDYGGGESCIPRLERTRVFCCDAASGKSLFLPVPLENLFPNPPTGDKADTEFDLQIDNTWGDGQADTSTDDDPDEATFAFWVLTSPEEIQVSLDKRDGSHWEVYECNDAVSEEEHTVKMVCTDLSEESNCGKIHLGNGVPGTIVQLPKGCGPSKYAVAKTLVPAANQSLPQHLVKRYPHLTKRDNSETLIWDLTFDYDWVNVPRDFGETQMRLDFSNEVGYWDNIVAKASSKKRKRSLEEMGNNHKRWLEEEWRDDFHHGALSQEELHKRWFGSDIVAWLTALVSPLIKPQFTHNVEQEFTAIIAKQKWGPCQPANGGPTYEAELDVRAVASIRAATSFGLTIITTLTVPPNLSQSYLFFKTKGDVQAVFTFDAEGRVVYQSGDQELIGLNDFPGATFSIPKLLTVGPNFKLNVALDAEFTIAGHMESRVDIASWDVQQTYPNKDQPKTLDSPDRQLTMQGLSQPTFDWSVKAEGYVTAHLKPSFVFGIQFDQRWGVGAAAVKVEADGWVRLNAKAEVSSSQDSCPFAYTIDAGANLYAVAEAPDRFGWTPMRYAIAELPAKTLMEGDICPSVEERAIQTRQFHNISFQQDKALSKRTAVFGPIIPIPSRCLWCPPATGNSDGLGVCGEISGSDTPPDPDEVSAFKRGLDLLHPREHYNNLQRRAKTNTICGSITNVAPIFDSSGDIIQNIPGIITYGPLVPGNCDDYTFGIVATPTGNTANFATEHILEFQMIKLFVQDLNVIFGSNGLVDPMDPQKFTNFCKYFKTYYYNSKIKVPVTQTNPPGPVNTPLAWIADAFPGKYQNSQEFVLLEKGVNSAKEGMWGETVYVSNGKMREWINDIQTVARAIQAVKDMYLAYEYHKITAVENVLKAQRLRVAAAWQAMDAQALPAAAMPLINRNKPNLGNIPAYTSYDLRQAWLDWSQSRADVARTEAERFMSTHITALQTQWYVLAAQKPALQTSDPVHYAVIERIEALSAVVGATTQWTNPFL